MRTLSLRIVISLIFLSAFSEISLGQDSFNASKMQSQFARSVESSVSSVEKAEWKTPVDLWVQASGASESKAKEIATDIVAKARKDLGQSLCVHVHNGDWKPLSNMCWTSP